MAQGAERIKMLADNYIPVRQLGNGNTTGFSFDFDMMSEAYVRVYRETDGVQELVPADEYTAELDGSAGGMIVFDTAPAAGTYIVIAREVPLTQETPYKTSSGFSAVRTEQDFDKQTAISQQLSDEIGRSIKMQVGTTGIDLTLPSASPGKAIVWNQSGNALKNSTINVDDVIDEVTKIKNEAASSAQDAADSAVSSGKSRDESAAWAKSAAETVDGFDLHAAEKIAAGQDPGGRGGGRVRRHLRHRDHGGHSGGAGGRDLGRARRGGGLYPQGGQGHLSGGRGHGL